MTDVTSPQGDINQTGLNPDGFQPNEVDATRGREQGLGVGERELNAQRDPGGDRTADEDEEMENGVSVNAGDEDALNQSVGVQGLSDEDEETSRIGGR